MRRLSPRKSLTRILLLYSNLRNFYIALTTLFGVLATFVTLE